jgi:hypothetical protein
LIPSLHERGESNETLSLHNYSRRSIRCTGVSPAAEAGGTQRRTAALAAANGVKFEKVEIEFEDGHAVFEFIGKGPNGKGYEVDVFHDGTIQEVEEEISMSDVPQVVRDTLNRFLPNIQPSQIEKSTRSNFTIWYEFDAKDGRGKEIDVDISGDGRRILIQDDDAG